MACYGNFKKVLFNITFVPKIYIENFISINKNTRIYIEHRPLYRHDKRK